MTSSDVRLVSTAEDSGSSDSSQLSRAQRDASPSPATVPCLDATFDASLSRLLSFYDVRRMIDSWAFPFFAASQLIPVRSPLRLRLQNSSTRQDSTPPVSSPLTLVSSRLPSKSGERGDGALWLCQSGRAAKSSHCRPLQYLFGPRGWPAAEVDGFKFAGSGADGFAPSF